MTDKWPIACEQKKSMTLYLELSTFYIQFSSPNVLYNIMVSVLLITRNTALSALVTNF